MAAAFIEFIFKMIVMVICMIGGWKVGVTLKKRSNEKKALEGVKD